MKISYISCLTFFYILHASILAEQFDYSTDIPHIYSNSSDICRRKRDADDEDVINRFEMERVSPLFEIVRHLPPFEDNWLSSPVTIPTFPSFSSIKLENESSSYDEYKIEVIKDEEHVIGENGKQFKENSALNWYYSAESYSSVNNFTSQNKDVLKSELHTSAPTFKSTSTVTETSIPKTSILRKNDDEHVVSHVPSLKGGSGTFLDFNLLGSSTTPKVDSTTPPKNEEVKPNITTRYFLLQSGRVVAINVTSVSSSVKPTSSSGQGSKNPLLSTFYFGSRIRNKNATKALNDSKEPDSIKVSITKPTAGKETTQINQRNDHSTYSSKSDLLKSNVPPTEKSQFHNKTTHNKVSEKQAIKHVEKSITIKPNIEYFRPQKQSVTPAVESFAITPHVEYSKLKQNSITEKSQQLKEVSVATKPQLSTENLWTKFIPDVTGEISTLDPAQKWWSEMKAAKKERLSLFTTTLKPKITTKASKHTVKISTDNLEKTVTDPFYSKSFDSMKTTSKETVTSATIELTGNARSAKLRMTEGQALHFSTTPASTKVMRTSSPINIIKWSTFLPSTDIIPKIDENSKKRSDEDLLEPSVPLSDVRHDFVRVVTLPPTLISASTFKPSISTVTSVKESPGSSRRPRYRGLSHVNLQAAKRKRIESSTKPSKEDNTFPSTYQLITNSFRRPVNYQWWNTASTSFTSSPTTQPLTTPQAKRTRPTFYLRNSASFQTIPPGSLTDRRTLTSATPNYDDTVVESLQPPLEDLLIISFEPTRKSMGSKEAKKTENLSQKQEKKNIHREATKTTKRPSTLIRNQEKHFVSTMKPQRKHVQSPLPNIRTSDQAPTTTRIGNRESRQFRNNSPRSQNVDGKASTVNPDTSTTKQPFRMYYFEPKRRRSKDPNAGLKNETAKSAFVNTDKPARVNVQRTSIPSRRSEGTRSTGLQNNGRTASTRQAKHLRSSSGEVNPITDPPTTPKPVNQRLRSSPFIWHRPNVGTAKSVA